jgi:hypothetical protein
VDRGSLSRHRRWITGIAAALIASAGWYLAASLFAREWLTGSSLPGFTFGVAGGLIILFEFLLWPRKQIRAARLGSAQAWLRAHIWLGLFVLPLLILHSGFRLGGTLSTVLMILLVIVVVSGIVGLVFQQILPRRLLEQVPGETVPTQIDRVMEQMRHDAELLVEAVCGPAEGEKAATQEEETEPLLSYSPAYASRAAPKSAGKPAAKKGAEAPIPDAEPLRLFYRTTVAPYLQNRRRSRSPLGSAAQADVLFQDLKSILAPSAHEAVDSLAGLCEQRRLLDEQHRIHFWLHSWLCIHLPLSAALLVLMFVHAWVALKYW